MATTDKTKEFEELTAKFNALCDEQEKLPREGFAKVFEVLDGMEETFTPQHPYTGNEDIINKALEITGHSNDEVFCEAFKRNNQIMIEGKKIQDRGLEIIAMPECEKMEKGPQSPNEWQFVGVNFIASPELHDDINERMKDMVERGKGLFANVTDIPLEDIDEDEFDMVEVYNCQATFTKYYAELKRFGIIGYVGDEAFLNETSKKILMILLKGLATYTKENTDKQAATKNKITDTIKILDVLPHWGLFLQILILQGLCRWLESVNINEGDKGFDEVQYLYDWLWRHLAVKIIDLAFKPYNDGDKARLKPLTDYLYSTEVGRLIQGKIFSEPQQDDISLPDELNTDKAKSILQKAINKSLCDRNYKWLNSKALLAYFADRASDYLNLGKGEYDGKTKTAWKPFETLFGIRGLSGARRDYQKTGTLPDGYNDINELFQ